MKTYDCIVLGLGGMGSSAIFHLARRGKRVLGLEQFQAAHDRGSSHGETRLIRQAYFEHTDYVPLLKRSYELWDELSERVGKPLLHRTGLVIFGPPEGKILRGIRRSAATHGLFIEEISKNLPERFPEFRSPNGYHAIYEPNGGFLEVENCIRAYLSEAERLGAELQFNEKVREWNFSNDGVSIETDKGSYFGKKLVVTAGPWTNQVLPKVDLKLSVHRAPLFWFQAPAQSPHTCFAFDLPYGFIYGFPPTGSPLLLKMAHHKPRELVLDPTHVDRKICDTDSLEVLQCARECFPGLTPQIVKSALCLYTMTPDENFILDRHPDSKNAVIAAGFSGHGFKFASVIGEVLTELALDGSTRHPIGFLNRR